MNAPDTLQTKYRALFLGSGTLGQDVLGDILQFCHFGCTLDPDNRVQVAEYNVGVAILARCGIFSSGMTEDVIRALAQVVPKNKTEG